MAIVVMRPGATGAEIDGVLERLKEYKLEGNVSPGLVDTVYGKRSTISVLGDTTKLDIGAVEELQGVEKAHRVGRPYKLVSREFPPSDAQVTVGGQQIGNGNGLFIAAGPCAVEPWAVNDESQFIEMAHELKEAGANALRVGAFKARSSPYTFEGLGEKALEVAVKAREATGLPLIGIEVMRSSHIKLLKKYEIDVWQIGARYMSSFGILDEVAEESADTHYSILLKRGMSATVEEWLLAAERLWVHGNPRIILCERGIRTYETETRNTPDPSAVRATRQLSKLPVFGDPTHSTGKREYAPSAAEAYIVAGAHGLEVEVHPHPERALVDGRESIRLKDVAPLFKYWRELFDLRTKNGASYSAVK